MQETAFKTLFHEIALSMVYRLVRHAYLIVFELTIYAYGAWAYIAHFRRVPVNEVRPPPNVVPVSEEL